MPVMMIALVALAVFGIIGVLLAVAVCCEPKKTADPDRPKGISGPVKAA
jgi:hypothetical protein